MSLDCYPFGARRTIDLREQPIAIDVAYDENLLITVVDNCRKIVVFDLEQTNEHIIGQFQLDDDIVIDQVVYSKEGDYIAAVGHRNGQARLYTTLNWRKTAANSQSKHIKVEELNYYELVAPFDEIDRSDKISSIDACQRTGNLAVSYGDLVVIYRLVSDGPRPNVREDEQANGSSVDDDDDDDKSVSRYNFSHLASIKLAIWASSVALSENYLSIMAMDHVQVLKLEVLNLQILSDNLDGDGLLSAAAAANQAQVNRSAGSSGDSHHQEAQLMEAALKRRGSKNVANETIANGSGSPSGDETSGSIVSGLTSNRSTRTNFSSFLATDNDLLAAGSETATFTSALGSSKNVSGDECLETEPDHLQLNNLTADSDLSVITMNNLSQQLRLQQQQQQAPVNAQDDCITWNLNTKKLVKLPTLMHNTSTDLSSFHICHPLELLGPASESIACRVGVRIYCDHLSENQLEPVVLLCKQFDFDRDPVKLMRLHPIYLSANLDEQKRLNRGTATSVPCPEGSNLTNLNQMDRLAETSGIEDSQLLKSAEHELLASVSCFVSTLTTCSIYLLTGKKVTRLQNITHPGLCLDLRADLLNVYLLTPLGLQVCSTSVCDAIFRHDWSSSADLNLSFVACNRTRVLSTKRHLVMISSSPSPKYTPAASDAADSLKSANSIGQTETPSETMASFVEVVEKPTLGELHKRIVKTIQCCQSISIRSNLLTYLQTTAQLELIEMQFKRKRDSIGDADQQHELLKMDAKYRETVGNLKMISMMLARQLLQKKQTNVITNGKIDRTIKHLLDNSYCDLNELMQRHLEDSSSDGPNHSKDTSSTANRSQSSARSGNETGSFESLCDHYRTLNGDEEDDEQADEEPTADDNFELLKIYLRYTKFNQSILDYLKSLIATSSEGESNENSPPAFERIIGYMSSYNPRLLIKCAQRITRELPAECLASSLGHLEYLMEQLRQLVKLNSTGINRATVLFTLAILYHEMAAAVGGGSDSGPIDSAPSETVQTRQQQLHEHCLSTLGQIKPLNHLAITMCSNHEIISKTMAKLVNEHYPQVFKLFLNQLQKRDELLAVDQFERLQGVQ